jgi:hypothetical protein
MSGAEALELYPEQKMRFSRLVAEELLNRFGTFAHMHALEAMDSRDQEHSRKLWRDVLTTLDEIINERKQDDKPELRTAESDKPE